MAADASADMLMQARKKAEGLAVPPLFLCQSAEELDLYGTVDAAICCLDSINYLTRPRDVQRTLRRLHLFVAPDGLFIFDINSPQRFRSLDGQVFVDETDEVLCLWRAEFDQMENALVYGMDLFVYSGDGMWTREAEEHVEYAHEVEWLTAVLAEAGFVNIRVDEHGPQCDQGRIFITAENTPH